jgi:hypothetical protein
MRSIFARYLRNIEQIFPRCCELFHSTRQSSYKCLDWLVSGSVGRLVSLSVGGWLVSGTVVRSIGWLVVQSVGRSVGWLVSWMVSICQSLGKSVSKSDQLVKQSFGWLVGLSVSKSQPWFSV